MMQLSARSSARSRCFGLLIVLFGVSCVTGLAERPLVEVEATPYDKQMKRIEPILAARAGGPHREITVRMVNSWLSLLRSIPYEVAVVWKTPAETESETSADCKAKALALYHKMLASGASHFRLVVGKRTAFSPTTHCWVEWDTSEGDFVLDPTFNWMAYRMEDCGSESYMALFAFEGDRKFRALHAAIVQQDREPLPE